MGDDALLCGVDAGTSRIRAILFDRAGRVIVEAARPTPTRLIGPGEAEHDAQALWDALAAALREMTAGVERPARIRGIACASMGEAGVLLDAAGRPTGSVTAWYDTRPAAPLADFLGRVGTGRVQEMTGLCPDPTFTLAKLLWLRATRPEETRSAVGWLSVSGWLAFRLSGERAVDLSLASRTMALDIGDRRWSAELLDAAGFASGLLGRITPAGSRLGTITEEAAAATGLPRECAVAVGAHDHIAGLLAVGADAPGVLMNSLGTAEALTLVQDAPVTDGRLARRGFHQGVIEVERPLAYVFGGLPTSAAAVEWFRELTGGADHADLVSEATAVPDGAHEVMFLPQLRLGSPPWTDPIGRGAFMGLSDGCNRGVLFRSVLEGLALDSAHQVEVLRELGLPEPARVVAIGGGTRNPLLMRLKAGLLGRSVEIPAATEATALGAAMLAGLGAGMWPDLAAAQRDLGPGRAVLEPEPGWTAPRRAARITDYAHAYEAHREIHARLRRPGPTATESVASRHLVEGQQRG